MSYEFPLPERMDNGQLPAYAWPGGYPLYYLDNENNVLCPSCANREASTEPLHADVNYENSFLYCDDCSTQIESAYDDDEVSK